MKKRLIALTVAALASGAASAQVAPNNVTLYGIIDAGYNYFSDPNTKSDNSSVHAIDSSGQSTTRFGIKGTEDLGDGLAAKFDVQFTFPIDTTGDAVTTYRKSNISLASATLGEIKLGSFATFEDDLISATNVVAGNATVGSAGKVYLANGSYYNALGYFSPVWSGLQLRAAVTTAEKGGEVEPSYTTTQATAKSNLRRFAIAAHYNNGPLIGGATYETNKYQNNNGLVDKFDSGDVWHLFGAYDFKVVRLNAAYGTYNYAANTAEIKDTRKQWQLGASTPIGANGLLAVNYAQAKIHYRSAATSDDKQRFWGVAYFHNLSKRTNIYTAYGDISQNDSNQTASKAYYGPSATANSGHGYQQAFTVGLRHQF